MRTRRIKSGRYYEIVITTDRSGRTSILVHDNKYPMYRDKPIIDVELPPREGEFKNSFKPKVKVSNEIETERV